MSVSIDTFGASFIHYLPGVVQTLNKLVKAKKLTNGRMKKWEGKYLSKHVHVSRNGGLSWASDGGAISPAARQRYVESKAYRRFLPGKVQITDGMLDNAKTTRHAAIRVVESELRGLLNDMKKVLNFFWTRDGTGVVGLLGSTTNGATITMDDARGIWDNADYTILDTDGSTEHATFTASKVARAFTSSEATVTPAASVASGSQAQNDYVVWGAGNYMSYNKAITGLDSGIDDASTTFQGLATSTYTRYTSPVISSVGVLQPDDLRQILAMIYQESGEEVGTMKCVTNTFGMLNMDAMFEGDVRITPDTKTVGTSTPYFQSTLGKIEFEHDPDSPYGKVFLFDPDEITLATQRDLSFRKNGHTDGSIFKRDDNALSYSATALMTCELFYEQRNKMGKLEGVTETKQSAF